MARLPTVFILLVAATAVADDVDERAQVLAVIDAFFDGMQTRDVERIRPLFSSDGVIYGYRTTPDGPELFSLTHRAYLENLATGSGKPVERYWDPEVMIYDRLATAWIPYDFHLDGEFSHCGVNNFSMIKDGDGWVIAGVVFSVETDSCEPSPLGPLDDSE